MHVPVALYPASGETGIDFDWLDKKTMDPVGYKRVNKRTGKEIVKENIVKGVKLESDSSSAPLPQLWTTRTRVPKKPFEASVTTATCGY